MIDEPVRLTLAREGEMIAIDLATADPIVPRSLVPVSEDLLHDIDEELVRLSTTAARWAGTAWSPQSPIAPPNALFLDQLKTIGRVIFSHLFSEAVRRLWPGAIYDSLERGRHSPGLWPRRWRASCPRSPQELHTGRTKRQKNVSRIKEPQDFLHHILESEDRMQKGVPWPQVYKVTDQHHQGLDFAEAPAVFAGPTFTFEDDRFAYEKQRFITLGLLQNQVVVIAHTERGEEARIILMRKGTKREQTLHFRHLRHKLGTP